jgi:hypothetical protein
MKKQLYTYGIDCWYRQNDEKEFMTVKIIAESDEFAKSLAKEVRRNIYKTEIKSKVPYKQ